MSAFGTLKIGLLFAILSLMLVGFGAIIGYFTGYILVWMSLFLVIALVMNVVSYFKSDSIAIKMTHSKIIQREENPLFYGLVETVAKKAGIPMPRVGIMPTDTPNAFATGRNENHAVVVATSGILKMLDENELTAVLGHEISHITHKDILVTTIAATIATIISYIGNMIIFSMLFGEENRGNNGMILLVAAILIPMGAMFVQLGISRSREADADEGSVRLMKEPDALISSLEKISKPLQKRSASPQGSSRNIPQPGAYSSMFLVNNFGGHSLLNLFSAHPSLEKRINNINRVRKELGI
jgi:heat shock protein HtpX